RAGENAPRIPEARPDLEPAIGARPEPGSRDRLSCTSAERGLVERAQLAGMQRLSTLPQQLKSLQSNLQMLPHRCLVKCVGRTRQFVLAVERLVRDAEESAVRHAEAISIGSDRAAFHVDRNGAREIDPPPLLRVAQLPVPIVVGDDRSRPQPLLKPVTLLASDDRRRIL